jgi:hypothetical protein
MCRRERFGEMPSVGFAAPLSRGGAERLPAFSLKLSLGRSSGQRSVTILTKNHWRKDVHSVLSLPDFAK